MTLASVTAFHSTDNRHAVIHRVHPAQASASGWESSIQGCLGSDHGSPKCLSVDPPSRIRTFVISLRRNWGRVRQSASSRKMMNAFAFLLIEWFLELQLVGKRIFAF